MRVPHLARVPLAVPSPGLVVPRAGREAAAGFLPTDIAGLKLWLRADTLALSDTDPVATWNDESGLGNHATQATSGNRPVYLTNQQNGLPGVAFTAASTHYLVANGVAAVQNGSDLPCTVFVVAKNDLETGGSTIINWASSASTTQRMLIDFGSVFRSIRRDNAGSQVIVGATTALGSAAARIATTSFSGTAVSFFLDAAANGGAAQNVGTMTIDVFSIGAHFRSGSAQVPWDGTLYEVVIYDTELSGTNRGLVETYLDTKWAI
jgi:hypothetical protein